MRAFVCPKYGPPEVLQPREMPKPVPTQDEVLVRVRATAVTASDLFIRGSDIPWRFRIPMRVMIGLTRPRKAIIGLVFAGDVEWAGQGVKRFRAGDRVYGLTGFNLGTYAEYLCMREIDSTHGCIAHLPSRIGYEAATAAAYGGLLALQHLEGADIHPGHRVLVYGASSTSGTIAVQVAKRWGAEVTGVCGPAHLELVRSLGADPVLDYTRQDHLDPAARFDFVLDAVGRAKTSALKEAARRALTPSGRYASIDDGALQLVAARLERLNVLLEAGQVVPVLDRCFPFSELVEAHRYVSLGHKAGGVAVTV
jgi:NADPH:quinone reductase-like Zn-dependent oxidoreductase